MVTVRICSKLKTSQKSVVLTNKFRRNFRFFVGVFKQYYSTHACGYEMITANSVLCPSLAIYHLISNAHLWIIVNYYSFKIFQCFWLTLITQLLLHNQLALKIYGRYQQYTALSHWFDGVFTWKQGWSMVYCICLEKRQLVQSELKNGFQGCLKMK